MDTRDHIKGLFRKYMNGAAMPDEVQELSELVEEYTNAELEEILEPLAISQAPDPAFRLSEWEPVIEAILQRRPELQKTRVIGMWPWKKIAAAVAVLLMLGGGSYFAFFQKNETDVVATKEVRYQNDIPPGGDKAVLTLADGRQIVLDSASGHIAKEGGVTVINLAGQLSYEKRQGLTSDVSRLNYHTVSTPRGGQYQLVLADGTKVWLNAASSLRFPTTFAGQSRVVELRGEGYFEVAHNASKPFHVRVNEMDVQVLGTHFNINAYEDEGAIRTTLLEGSVKVSTARQLNTSTILKPGQQAQVTEQIKLVRDVDVDKVIAWKNGLFNFEGAGLVDVMRQLARWYDIEVVYEKNIPQMEFGGKMSRNVPLSDVLKGLEDLNVHFRIEGGRRLVVMP